MIGKGEREKEEGRRGKRRHSIASIDRLAYLYQRAESTFSLWVQSRGQIAPDPLKSLSWRELLERARKDILPSRNATFMTFP